MTNDQPSSDPVAEMHRVASEAYNASRPHHASTAQPTVYALYMQDDSVNDGKPSCYIYKTEEEAHEHYHMAQLTGQMIGFGRIEKIVAPNPAMEDDPDIAESCIIYFNEPNTHTLIWYGLYKG